MLIEDAASKIYIKIKIIKVTYLSWLQAGSVLTLYIPMVAFSNSQSSFVYLCEN